jgi:PAS domain S-box-containing protein
MGREWRGEMTSPSIFAGPGEARSLGRAMDWGATAVGPLESWPPSLRTIVRMCLDAPLPMGILAAHGRTLIYNDLYAALLGPAKHPWAFGRGACEIWPEVWSWLGAEIDRVIGNGESVVHHELRLPLERAGGAEEEAFFTSSITPIRDDDGRVVSALNVMVETTDRVRAFTQRTALLQGITQSSQDAIFAKDLDGRILFANPATLEILGKPAEQILGKTDLDFVDDAAHAREVMANDRRVLETGQPMETEEPVRFRDGTLRIFHAAKAPFRDQRGQIIGLLGISRDITDRKRQDEALRAALENAEVERQRSSDSEADLREAQRLAGLGSWKWEVGGAIAWSDELFAILGRDLRAGPPTIDTLSQSYTPEAWNRLGPAIEQAATTGVPYELELEMVRADGTTCWTITRGEALRDPSGAVVKLRGTSQDITDRKRAEQERERLVTALREADRHKDEFLGMLSHELRNPLTPMRNSVDILQRATPGGEHDRRARIIIDRQLRQLTRLVDDLLDVTRISRGKIRLQKARLDFVELVGHTIDDHRSLFEGRELAVALPDRPLWVLGDPARLAQTIGNLLQNAAKFTQRGESVSVSLHPVGERAVVGVADTGPGIEPGLLPRLFEPFAQAEEGLARTRGGLGLGLALVKGLVEQHGGTVTASSEGAGKGARFTLSLPLDEQPASTTAVEPSPPEAGKRIKVLVIEDNVDAADSLGAVLDLDGYEVMVSYGPRDGIAKAHTFRPDVLLCDVGLPEMSGYEVARAFRNDPALKNVLLVALTGYAGPEDQRQAVEAGFQRHFPKPPNLDALEQLLATAAATSHAA